MEALKAGKHVSLEKPSGFNASEARSLLRYPLVAKGGKTSLQAVISLDAVHIRFRPVWQRFLSFIDSSKSLKRHLHTTFPRVLCPAMFQYDLSGGCLMDSGSYNVQMPWQVLGTEPVECLAVSVRRMPNGLDQNTDQAFGASWIFLNGGIESIVSDLAATGGHSLPWLTSGLPSTKAPMCSVKDREKTIRYPTLEEMETITTKIVIIGDALLASIWHRIDIIEDHTLGTRVVVVLKNSGQKTHISGNTVPILVMLPGARTGINSRIGSRKQCPNASVSRNKVTRRRLRATGGEISEAT